MALKIFKNFDPRANPIDGNYSTGSIKNESAPGANDGTPLDADWGNDYVGFTDALLNETGVVPSGNPDTAVNSDRLTALKKLHTNNLEQTYDFASLALMTASIIVFLVGKNLKVANGTNGLYSMYKVTNSVTLLPLAGGLYAQLLETSFDPSLTTVQAINNNSFNNSNPRGNKLQLFAHRGMAFQFPENTIVACSSSINLGVDGLELDAAVSADGVTYLFHDETVDALTDGTGTFTDLNAAYIDTLKFTSTVGTILADEKIPRLIDVLKLARQHGIYVLLEVKLVTANADIDLIIADIIAAGMEHLVSLQSGNLTNVQYIRSVNTTLNVGYITADPVFATYIDILVTLGNTSVNAQHDMIFANPGIVKYARDRGVDIQTYTVNDNIFAKRIQEVGVYKIISDRLTGELQR